VRKLEVTARAFECIHTVLVEAAQQGLILSIRESVHGFDTGGICGVAFGQADPAAGEKRADAVEPRLAVNVQRVVDALVERREPTAGPLDPPRDELVEGLRPRCGVNSCAADQHPVEGEDARLDAAGKSEQLPCVPRRERKRRQALRAAVECQGTKELRRRLTLGGEAVGSDAKLLGREVEGRGAQSVLSGVEGGAPLRVEPLDVDERLAGDALAVVRR
jgi:hypothetical protein